jgi:putative transcriptional regulator
MADTDSTTVDWTAIDAMNDDDIARQVNADPDVAPLMDDVTAGAVLAQRARKATGLSQRAFAARIGVSLGTIRDWEQGRHMPDSPARALLRVIREAPDATMATLTREPEPS